MTAYKVHIKVMWADLCSSRSSHLFVSQSSGGFEGRRGTQTAEGPGLADLWWFQGATTDGAEAAQVGQVSRGTDHAQRLAFHSLYGTVKGNKTN